MGPNLIKRSVQIERRLNGVDDSNLVVRWYCYLKSLESEWFLTLTTNIVKYESYSTYPNTSAVVRQLEFLISQYTKQHDSQFRGLYLKAVNQNGVRLKPC